MEGVSSGINTPFLNQRPASPPVRSAGDRQSPVAAQQTSSAQSADTTRHISIEQARENSDSLPSDPPRASRMLNTQAHIAANVTGEIRAKEADGENKRLQDQQVETNEDGTLRQTTLFEEVDEKKYKTVSRYGYRNGEKSSVSTERHQVGEDGADMLSERKAVNYLLGTSDGKERVHSEIVQKFDGSEDKPLETRNTQFHNNGSVFETRYEQGSPSMRGKVREASITKRNPDGSNLEISYHGGAERPRVTVNGEGSLTRDEFNRIFGSLPGADKLTEFSSGRTVNVSSSPEGSAVFSVKGGTGSEKTLTINNSFSREAGVTFEDKFAYDLNVTINRDVHYNDGRHLTSRESYKDNVLNHSKQTLKFANGETEERSYFNP